MESIYLFSRVVTTSDGASYTQAATVFAPDTNEAERLLKERLKTLRAATRSDGADGSRKEPTLQEKPDWTIDETELLSPMVVAMFLGRNH